MVLPLEPAHYLEYLLKRDVSKLYVAVAIRNLALGMVLLFEPIYIYLYFDKSLPVTLIFFALMFGFFGLLAPLAGRMMAKLGTTRAILLSLFFYFAYYLCLFFLPVSFWFVVLAIPAVVVGMMLFWPAFHVDFARFSSEGQRGKDVGKLNVLSLVPMVASPAIGGWVLASFGYPVLFITVLAVLFASSIPLFYCKETHEVYLDSYRQAWRRAFKRENWGSSAGYVSYALENIIFFLFWPLFLFVLAINFETMGEIASFALIVSSLFMLYVGRVSDTTERPWLLNVGALWTAISWVIKFFVGGAFDAFLAHTLYRISQSAANIPFQTFFYEKVAQKGEAADEFIINREIIINIARFVFLTLLAAAFLLFPTLPINVIFFIAAFFALGFMFVGQLPRFSLK